MASVNIKEDDIYLILKNFNPEKAQGWDNISIRIIQLWRKAIVEPLQILFWSFLEEGVYPDDWKKNNEVPIHKKESKNLIKNYRPINLPPVSSKVSEEWFLTLCSITSLKISYLLNVSQVFYEAILASHNSFLFHTKYINFLIVNSSVDVRGTFLDISKVFDKVWHDGLIYKLKSYDVENKL